MNSPLKKKVQKFSKYEEECQSKITLINSIKQNMSKVTASTLLFNRIIMSTQKIQEKPTQLPFHQFVNINFDYSQKKTILIKEKQILSNAQNGKMFVIMIQSEFQIHATLIVNLNGYEKKLNFKILGTKAIPINQYFKDDVKLTLFAEKVKVMSQARLHLDLIKSSFSSGNKFDTISPKKKKQEIQQYLNQNRGKSAEILKRRSQTRQKLKRDRYAVSAASLKKIFSEAIFDPTASFYNKKEKSQLHLFEDQKSKYLKHMKKMSPDKQVLLKKTQSQYMSKKQQQIRKFASLVILSRFQKESRLKVLERVKERIKRIKISMLVTDFCTLMKSKLRFKITQKARYRMAIRTPLGFLGDIFYTLGKPKAQNKVKSCFDQIQKFKTLLKLGQHSVRYIQKLRVIQRYTRKKRAQMRQRAKIILEQLIRRNFIRESDIKSPKQIIIEKYLRVCYSQVKSKWITGLYSKTNILIKLSKQ